MSHKVHPKIFRLKELSDWDSRWLDKKKFTQYLEEDFRIREFLGNKLGKIGIERIEIERFPGKINIIISSARPGLIIGRGGGGVEELKRLLENKVLKISRRTFVHLHSWLRSGKGGKREMPTSSPIPDKVAIRIEIREVKNPWLSASLSSQWVAQQIEKRIAYRRALKQTIEKIATQKGVEGCRIELAGRLNGNEIARTEWLKKGKLPRQTLRADIDYAQAQAHCTYGVVGVKVWIYKGEKF
jgi:small subunit ribosomal protein S3